MSDESLASRILFDREVDRDTLAEWTAQAAAPKPSGETRRTGALLVRAGEEWIAIPASIIDQALPAGPIHKVPFLSNRTFLGLCNVDGELTPCVSLAALIGAQPGTSASRARFIAVSTTRGRFALLVDEALGTHGFDPAALSPPPDTLARSPRPVIRAMAVMEGRHAAVADEERLAAALEECLRP